MRCTVFGGNRKPLLDFLSSYTGRLFTLHDGGTRFPADGVFLEPDEHARGFLLAAGENARHFSKLSGTCLIACGLSSKDTFGLSSVTDEKWTFAVLREIPLAFGGVCEVQEIPSPRGNLPGEEEAVLAAATLLVCGISPHKLSQTAF